MGSEALIWLLVAVSGLVALVSLARLAAADSAEVRFASVWRLVLAGLAV
ncbi:hypothetical protein ABZ499_20145 [Streptomyces sp. NPDC019990]